jgi:hypothetical protein
MALVYRDPGQQFVSRSCFNPDRIGALSLILVGVIALSIALASPVARFAGNRR